MAWVAAMNAAMAAASKTNDPNGGMSPADVSTGLAIVGAIALGVLAVALLPEAAVAATAGFLLRMLIGSGAAALAAAR
jgi:hypothetical protein